MVENITYLALILILFIFPPVLLYYLLYYLYGIRNQGAGSNQPVCKLWEEHKWILILAEGMGVVVLAGYLYYSTRFDIEIKMLLVTAYLWSQLFYLGFLVHICKKVRMKNSPPHDANPDRKEQA